MKIPFVDVHIRSFLKDYSLEKDPLDLALSRYYKRHKSLGAKDRRIMGGTLYGIIRWYGQLSFFDPDPLDAYRALQKINFTLPQNAPIWDQLGASPFLYEKLASSFGEVKAKELLSILNTEAPMTIRVNRLKISREELFKRWNSRFSMKLSEAAEDGIVFSKREPLFSLPEFKEGLFEVQDEGSQIVSSLINPIPGETVLDYCAGSGGKTLSFAHKTKNKGQIYLHDIRSLVLQEAKKRLRRAGVQNAQCLSSDHPQLKKLKGKCDWVLVDTPCSGSGTLRRNPEQKWRLNAPMLERLVATQREILKEAVSYLTPKGKLVYVTCSLFPEENEGQLSQLSLSLERPPLFLEPKRGGNDGFFAAILRKS